ncbi:MAG TPA: ACT domain-containing protein, partial [Tepidisphaeraceae bacterium]|nr:ACT domain-containing protein [Tepidisphaeraceae bacterium]
LRFDNYAMDMIPESTMVLIENKDQPGMIGIVGTMFGDAKVNIADMVLSRDVNPDGTAHALMVIKTDSDPGETLLNQLRARPGILRAQAVKLPPRG